LRAEAQRAYWLMLPSRFLTFPQPPFSFPPSRRPRRAGCVVNGPGESKHSHIRISLPGTFDEPVAPVYVDGRLTTKLRGDRIVAEFIEVLDRYAGPMLCAKRILGCTLVSRPLAGK